MAVFRCAAPRHPRPADKYTAWYGRGKVLARVGGQRVTQRRGARREFYASSIRQLEEKKRGRSALLTSVGNALCSAYTTRSAVSRVFHVLPPDLFLAAVPFSPMTHYPYCRLSSLFGVFLVILSAKCNGAAVAAFLTEDKFCAARPIPNACTLINKKQNNVCGTRIFHIDTHSTILSAKTNDGANGKYLGALHRAVQTGDTRKLDRHKKFWVERCLELVEYERKHGNCDVPLPWNRREKGTQLQNWVKNQRTQYRFYQQDKGPCSMTEERIAILEDMGFRWEITGWSGEQARWKMRYEELIEYKGKYGDCNVPKGWKENPKLANWVAKQRVEYRLLKEGKKSDMTDERIAMLEDVGFEWYVNVEWELRYEELKQYKERYGNCNVPQRWKENPKLANWVEVQRRQYRLLKEDKKSDMTVERIEMLEDIGFEWYVKGPQVEWEMRYEELKQYKEKYGDCNVPRKWKKNPQLGRWVGTQRYQYRLLKEGKKSQMTDERIDMLEKIEFEWYVYTDWELRYEELKQYKKQYGNCNVPKGWKKNPPLANWVDTQRRQYRLLKEGKKSTMTAERIDMLEKIGFEWKVRRGRRRETKT